MKTSKNTVAVSLTQNEAKRVSMDDFKGRVYMQHPEYEDILVSNLGDVIKINKMNGLIWPERLAVNVQSMGYHSTVIHGKSTHIGRLVLETFKADEYFEGAECDHINRNKRDNRVENLRWVSHKENCNNRSYKRKHNGKRTPIYFLLDDGTVQYYSSTKACMDDMQINQSTLQRLLATGQHSVYGGRFIWSDEVMKQTDEDQMRIYEYEQANRLF